MFKEIGTSRPFLFVRIAIFSGFILAGIFIPIEKYFETSTALDIPHWFFFLLFLCYLIYELILLFEKHVINSEKYKQ